MQLLNERSPRRLTASDSNPAIHFDEPLSNQQFRPDDRFRQKLLSVIMPPASLDKEQGPTGHSSAADVAGN